MNALVVEVVEVEYVRKGLAAFGVVAVVRALPSGRVLILWRAA